MCLCVCLNVNVLYVFVCGEAYIHKIAGIHTAVVDVYSIYVEFVLYIFGV